MNPSSNRPVKPSLLQQLSLWLDRIVEILLLVMGIVIGCVLFAQVLFRFLGHSLGWSEELSRQLLVAITFLGGSSAYKKAGFIGLKGIGERLGAGGRRAVLWLLQGLSFACFGLIAWFGCWYTIKAWEQTSTALEIPMSIPYAVIPLSAFIMLIHVLADMQHGNDIP
ncbi:TRAP transporter small permease [Desulfatirhabdium butyrativorans]|uniref:TRAP transporter small permease n=1 Tax=Desulfatirhabdium butyrativorans TaxID=340467 RepID=UPI0005540FA7|nr:TRAP transporter small permease [Desulfatirhabdium butyrativorans]